MLMIPTGDLMNNATISPATPRRDNRKLALAQIHIAKKQLAMDEDVYRDMLVAVTGKNRCKEMHISALYLVIKHLEKCGFKRKNNAPRQQKKQLSPKASGQYIDVMRALWINMHQAGMIDDGSELALTRWAKRQSRLINGGIGIDELVWLERNAALAQKVIESLKQWHKRVLRQWRNDDALRVRTYCEQWCLESSDVIKTLFIEQKIMYWPEFESMGIHNTAEYCTCRKELAHV